MSSGSDKPISAPSIDDEVATWVETAHRFVDDMAAARALNLDYSWRSLHELDAAIDDMMQSRDQLPLKLRLGIAAYVGEILVRQFGGRWATGEQYGQVLPPPAGSEPAEDSPAHPTQMVEIRLSGGDSLQHQVFEQSKAWKVESHVVGSNARVDGPAAMMRLAADAFVKSAGTNGVTWLDYSPESVMRLDQLIAEWWPSAPPKETYEAMVPAIGAYLGEVLVAQTGARWIRDPAQGYGVEYHEQVAFPMREVSRRFQLGPDHAIGQFYNQISNRWLWGKELPSKLRDGDREKRNGLFGRGKT